MQGFDDSTEGGKGLVDYDAFLQTVALAARVALPLTD